MFCYFCGSECGDAPGSLIGRHEELTTLVEVAGSATSAGQGRVALVLGDRGIGKTRLLDELSARLAASNVPVFRLEGRLATGRPLEAIAELLRDVLGVARGTNIKTVDPAVLQKCSALALTDDDVARLIDRLSGRPSGLHVVADVLEREESSALKLALARILAAAPCVLLVENADLLDAAARSWLLGALEAARRTPVSVIVTTGADPWPQWSAPHAVRLVLPLLDAASMRQLLANAVGRDRVTQELFDDARVHSRGSAFLLESFVRSARTCIAGNAVDRRRLAGLLHSGPSALVALALRALPADAREWIECASLLELRAPLAMLAEIAGGHRPAQEIAGACSACWFVSVDGDHLRFPTRSWRDAVRRTIDPARLQQLNHAIASWYEQTAVPRAPLEVIAQHLEASGADAAAAAAFSRVASDLGTRHAYVASAMFWARAAEIRARMGDVGAASRCSIAQVEALVEAHDPLAARWGREITEDSRFADMLRARALAVEARLRGDFEQTVRILSRGSDGAGEALAAYAWFELETELAEVYLQQGVLPDAMRHAALAHDLAVSCSGQDDVADGSWGVPAMLAMSSQTRHKLHRAATLASSALLLAHLQVELGKLESAGQVLDHCVQLQRIRDDAHATARLLAAISALPPADDPAGRKLEIAERALGLARSVGDRRLAASVAADLAARYQKLGRAEPMQQYAALATSLSESTGWREPAERCASLVKRPTPSTPPSPRPPVRGEATLPLTLLPMGDSIRPPVADQDFASQPTTGAAQFFYRIDAVEPSKVVETATAAPPPAQDATPLQRARPRPLLVITVVVLTSLLVVAIVAALRADRMPPQVPSSAAPAASPLP